jgi:hypothetical protein
MKWESKVPIISHFRTIGCTTYVLDENVPRGAKFRDRTQAGRLVGYENGGIYRI